MNWLERWQRRRYEIARGADADLFADNARRYRWSLGLLAAGALLWWASERFQLAHALRVVTECLAGLLAITALILVRWANEQDRFLRKPGPEGPPSIIER